MIANIAFNDATILPYNANPSRIEFSERTGYVWQKDHLQQPLRYEPDTDLRPTEAKPMY